MLRVIKDIKGYLSCRIGTRGMSKLRDVKG